MFRFKTSVIAAGLLLQVTVMPAANIPVVTGLNAITIPTLFSLNYSAYNVFSTAQDGEIIYVWNGAVGAWDYYTCDFGYWDPIAPVFIAGQGIFYNAVGPQTFVANFHANFLSEGARASEAEPYVAANATLAADRYYFQGLPSGERASFEDIFGGPPPGETTLFRFVPGSSMIDFGSSSYQCYYYNAGVWSPEAPDLNPLEPVFVVYPTLRLNFTRDADTIYFTWPIRGRLESAPSPTGPWRPTATINGANELAVTPLPQDAPQYYRVSE